MVGDAFGVPGTFKSREELRAHPIFDMIGGGIDYEDQMQRFSDWLWSASNTARDEVFDVGGTTKHAVFRFVKRLQH